MRIRITFLVKNAGTTVPFHHQHLIAQVIRGLVLFAGGDRFVDFTDYSFSGLKGQTQVSREGLHFTGRYVTLVVSSPSRSFLAFLVRAMFEQDQLSVESLRLSPEQVEEEVVGDMADEMTYLCLSPVVLIRPVFNGEQGKFFVDPATDRFSDIIFTATIRRMQAAGLDPDHIDRIENFQLIPDPHYIRRMYDQHKKIARIYTMYDQDIRYEVRGYVFPFTLYAPEEVQAFVYTHGLGEFAHKGFGLLDIADSSRVKKVVPFEYDRLITV